MTTWRGWSKNSWQTPVASKLPRLLRELGVWLLIGVAVSLAVDRNALAKSAYAGYATAARSVYNPAFGLAASTRLFAEAADAAAAKQQIALSKSATVP